MPRLNKNQRYEAIGMLRAMSCKDIAAHFNVDRKTIERLRIKYNRTGDVADLQRPGAPRKTNAAEDRFIVTSHRRNRFKCGTETETGSGDFK